MSNAYRAVVSAGGGAAVGDATAADVLTGKTFSGAVGSGVSGTMPNNGAVSETLAAGQSYTVPAGYHNGSGTVTAANEKRYISFGGDGSYIYFFDSKTKKSYRLGSTSTINFDGVTVSYTNQSNVSLSVASTLYKAPATPVTTLNDMTSSDVAANTSVAISDCGFFEIS